MKKLQIRKGILILLSLLLVVLVAASCGKKTEAPADGEKTEPVKKITLRLVVPAAAGDELTVKDEEMAKRFNERVGGTYEIKVYPGGSLVKVPEFMDAVRTGAVEMFDAAAAIYGGADPRFNITMLPYLFDNGKAVLAAQQDLVDFHTKITEEKFNQKVIGYVFVGSFDLASSEKPITKPEDLKGMLVGCPDPALIAAAETLGATPISVPWPDFYTSLDKGVVDGIYNSLNGSICNKLFDVLKYNVDLQTPVGTNMYSINLDIWNAMPKETQDILVEEVTKTCTDFSKYYIDQYAKDVETARGLGADVHLLSDQERQAFKDVFKPYTEKMLEQYGEAGKQMKEIADKANAKAKTM